MSNWPKLEDMTDEQYERWLEADEPSLYDQPGGRRMRQALTAAMTGIIGWIDEMIVRHFRRCTDCGKRGCEMFAPYCQQCLWKD